jgi:holin-like protein
MLIMSEQPPAQPKKLEATRSNATTSSATAASVLALRGFAWLLVLQTAGELAARQLGLSVPGPVVGMVLLLFALKLPSVRLAVAGCAEFLLSHLSLLFVPVGVGVMTHLGIFNDFGVRIAVVLVVSTWVGLAVTAWALRWLQRRTTQAKLEGQG